MKHRTFSYVFRVKQEIMQCAVSVNVRILLVVFVKGFDRTFGLPDVGKNTVHCRQI
jgi:hypothetical protein